MDLAQVPLLPPNEEHEESTKAGTGGSGSGALPTPDADIQLARASSPDIPSNPTDDDLTNDEPYEASTNIVDIVEPEQYTGPRIRSRARKSQ